jgi:hypothetical protein
MSVMAHSVRDISVAKSSDPASDQSDKNCGQDDNSEVFLFCGRIY